MVSTPLLVQVTGVIGTVEAWKVTQGSDSHTSTLQKKGDLVLSKNTGVAAPDEILAKQ